MDQAISFDLLRLAGLLDLSSHSRGSEAGGRIEAVFNTLACNINTLLQSYQEIEEQNFHLKQKLRFCACNKDQDHDVQNGCEQDKRKRDRASQNTSLDLGYLPSAGEHGQGGSIGSWYTGSSDESTGGSGGIAEYSEPTSHLSDVSNGSSTTHFSNSAGSSGSPAPLPEDVIAVAKTKMSQCGYDLLECIGQGAFGLVVSAKNLNVTASDPNQEVAIKFTDCADIIEWTSDPSNPEARCPKEAEAMLRLEHVPSVVNLFGFGEFPINGDTFSFMIMEKPDGCRSFYQYLQEHRPIGEERAWFFLEQLVSIALDIHRSGLVHGDLKPGNLLICAQDRLKVIDFGLVEDVVEDRCLQHASGGTRRWNKPPERYHGDTDLVEATVWSVGVMFYYMVFGSVPFSSPKKACKRPLIMLRPVTKRTKTILHRLLERNPRNRATIYEMEQLVHAD